MDNALVLSYFLSILPKLILCCVCVLLFYKIYLKIRSRYSVKVNCWFCNENSKVPYLEGNSWTCTKCEQYNGFTKDGNYNREIKQQFVCNSSSNSNHSNSWLRESTAQNGFCDACNEAQRLKVEKLSQFEPKKESRFDEELLVFKKQLEEQYRLCATCERHLKSVLRNKKKMVLGSKFLEYVLKSAEAIKSPNFNLIKYAHETIWKRRLCIAIIAMTGINVVCILNSLPELNGTWFLQIFGEVLGSHLFIMCSHAVALWRVFETFLSSFLENDTVVQIGLFARTIFMMILYSLGLRLPQIVRLNFLSLYMMASPFLLLATTLLYNVLDRFKITRYTASLILWSICAGGMEYGSNTITQAFMFLTSFLTFLFAVTSKVESSPKLYDKTANSFHKIYADEYASDLDSLTSSILSNNQLDCSSVSMHSDVSHSFATLKPSTLSNYNRKSPLSSSTMSLNMPPMTPFARQTYERKSPVTSSTFSLNQTPRQMQDCSLNASFRSYYGNDNTLRSPMGNSALSFAVPNQNPFNTSSQQSVRSQQRPKNSLFSLNQNNSFANSHFSERETPFRYIQHENQLKNRTPSLRSPFSASTNTLHLERQSRLFSPAQFSLNNTIVGFSSSRDKHVISDGLEKLSSLTQPYGNFNLGPLPTVNEDLSRASSRSSGFESQNEHLNNSRENSCGAEPSDLQKRLDSSAFQPVNQHNFNNGINNTFSLLSLQQPQLLPSTTNNCTQPLSINCSSEWRTTNSIPFNAMNSSVIKRGDLLRKWKNSAPIS